MNTNDTSHSYTGEVRMSLAVYAAAEPTVQMIVLLGSSSRGDAGAAVDMEIGYIAAPGFDDRTFQQLAAAVLDLPRVSLADLRQSPTAAFRAAREGALVYERTPGLFADFREETIHNWCELSPVIRAVYDRIEARAVTSTEVR